MLIPSPRLPVFLCLAAVLTAACAAKDDGLKRFPVHRLVVREADIRSSLNFNPPDYPPRQRWNIGIGIAPVELGRDAAAPAIETSVSSPIIITDLELPVRSWRELAGSYAFAEPQCAGSFYVTERHNPVDVISMAVRQVGERRFALDLLLRVGFEFEDSGYRDETVRLRFEADYEQFSFLTPVWSDPREKAFPPEWGVPSSAPKWPSEDVRYFVEKHVDLTTFRQVRIEETAHEMMLTATP